MNLLTRIQVGLVGAAVALALPAYAGGKKEEKVKLQDCPAAVQKTIKNKAGGGEILEVERETKKDGTILYEAEVKKPDGKKVDIEVAEDGRLMKVEANDEDEDEDKDDDLDNK